VGILVGTGAILVVLDVSELFEESDEVLESFAVVVDDDREPADAFDTAESNTKNARMPVTIHFALGLHLA